MIYSSQVLIDLVKVYFSHIFCGETEIPQFVQFNIENAFSSIAREPTIDTSVTKIYIHDVYGIHYLRSVLKCVQDNYIIQPHFYPIDKSQMLSSIDALDAILNNKNII
jgi:hypothetical protein